MHRGRLARVVGLTLAMMAVSTGAASASEPPVANGSFRHAGVEVFADDTVGVGCRTFGFCDGDVNALVGSADPQYVSTRAGEAVIVTCRSGSVAQVVGFFDGSDAVSRGWVNRNAVGLRGTGTVPACGAF